MKEKTINKYDKELKGKMEELVRIRRGMENMAEELELEKKRNKNF